MRIYDYIKSKWLYGLSLIVSLGIVIGIMNIVDLETFTVIFITFIIFIASIVPIITEYIQKKNFYKTLQDRLAQLDKKTLILEVIERPNFLEGEILYEMIEDTNKSMNDEIAIYSHQVRSYMEYINLWVHEIKTPISVTKLVAANNQSEVMDSILEELDRIEKYVEQVLYYSKSFTANLDFKVESYDLDQLVSSVLKDNAKALISKKVRIDKEFQSLRIVTDGKWLKFIMSQLISNSLQYMDKKEKVLKFSVKTTEEDVLLSIEDNGMGIAEKELNKVFDKGYVGENGRLIGKSTGFGLYICRKLCNDLDIGLDVESDKDKFTIMTLRFAKAHK